MPMIAFCSISAMDRSLADAVALAARCGADGIEVTARAPHLETSADLPEVRAAGDRIRSSGLEVTAYGSYLSYGGDDFEADVRREVARSEALGTERLRVWAGHAGGTVREENRDDVVRMLRLAGKLAADVGIDVVVERHRGTFADTADRTEALLDAVGCDNVALNYQVLDGLPRGEAEQQPDDARRLIPRSRYFHVKNYRENQPASGPLLLGGDLEHGVLDYRAILAAAVGAGYRGPYGIEFLAFDQRPLEGKLASGIAWLRGLLVEVGAP
ncbi:MAG: sugar phosphate isomerase/epimerase [Myxococcales bacterium]|nr:sugar phosphate isomerase/epimerase [Myxococcales bacterium]